MRWTPLLTLLLACDVPGGALASLDATADDATTPMDASFDAELPGDSGLDAPSVDADLDAGVDADGVDAGPIDVGAPDAFDAGVDAFDAGCSLDDICNGEDDDCDGFIDEADLSYCSGATGSVT